MKLIELEGTLATRLTKARYIHSLGVAQLAEELAAKFNLDREKAYLAGLLHDCARDMEPDMLLKISEQQGLIRHEVERRSPWLLHGPVGAFLAAKDFGIDDQEIIKAIRYHTTLRPEMGLLEQLIYLADMIEPGRSFPGLEQIRQQLAATSLTKGTELLIVNSLIYNINQGVLIHPLTLDALNWLRTK